MLPIRVAILTVSDGVLDGTRRDGSGDEIATWAAARGHEVVAREVVPDETVRIASALARLADSGNADLLVTTGGPGFTERDVTPEATLAVADRVMPGFGGQEFDPIALTKLRTLQAQLGDKLLLEVDGGVNERTIAQCARAGAHMLVVGAAIFQRKDLSYSESLAELNAMTRE